MAKVNLDIVGMFLNQSFDVELVDGTASVEDVLDAAVSALENAGGDISLRYISEGRQLDGFTVTHRSAPTSRSGRVYPDGIYTFADPKLRADPKGVPVWQYYVANAEGVPQSRDDGFIPFRDARFAFEDGWTVIWRCVLIFTLPERPLPLKLASK